MTTADAPSSSAPPRGLLLVISGPSGVGKTSIVRAVRQRLDAIFSVSVTTRAPTEQDVPGVDYIFVDEETFDGMVRAGAFIEYARVFGRSWYGTPRAPVERSLSEGRIVILDIDVQGALQVREAMPDAFMIFVEPPSEEELLRRLQSRARDDDESIERRFREATHEMKVARESNAYQCFVVNDDLVATIDRVCALTDAERFRAECR